MFNVNDNNDDMFKKEKEKNGKTADEVFDFKGFSHMKEEVTKDEKETPKQEQVEDSQVKKVTPSTESEEEKEATTKALEGFFGLEDYFQEHEEKVDEKETTETEVGGEPKVKETTQDNEEKKEEVKREKSIEEIFHIGEYSEDDEVVEEPEVEESSRTPLHKKEHISFNHFEEVPVEEEIENKKRKSSLKERFEQNRAAQKQLKVEKAEPKKEKKPKKVRKRRRQKRLEDFEVAKKRRAYKYKKNKYIKVKDFITYLNGHYLELDEIAAKVLVDENFHGWLKKRSKRFDESIHEFREIIEIIGN